MLASRAETSAVASLRQSAVERAYALIKLNSGRVTVKYLEQRLGSRRDVRYAITRLTLQGRIKRIKGFGQEGIVYYYHALMG